MKGELCRQHWYPPRRPGAHSCAPRPTVRVTIPIVYLPRSTPPSQVSSYLGLIHDPLIGSGNEEELVTADLSTNSARAALDKLQTSAQVFRTAPYRSQQSSCQLMRCLLIADDAVTKDIRFWRFNSPDAHAVVFETAFATAAPRQGRFLGYLSHQEGQDNGNYWEYRPRDISVESGATVH